MKTITHSWIAVRVLALLIGSGSVSAQTAPEMTGHQFNQSRSALIDSTKEYKVSTEELFRLEEIEVKRTAAGFEQLRQLFAEGIIARREIEESEIALAAAQAKLEARRGQIAEADRLIAEIEAAEELASRPLSSPRTPIQARQSGNYRASATVIRYTGQTAWGVANLSALQSFFSARFGRTLPTSAVGQTATHNSLGFDHRHAVDVALHPDSAEGLALINYLQSAGISFLAFRTAVPGSSTGAHIHIGRPSHRIA